MFVNRNTQLFCIAFLSILPNVLFGELLSHISFEKPFDTISADGVRLIGTNWDFGGSTTVNRHFVRLTPDRQSKKGFIWSNKAIEKKEWSLVFTFRISGQAENWFGDGLALWITSSTSHQEGDNHGFIGNFKGFGFLFDTFINQEHSGGHQDVTFYENDGSKTLDDLNYMNKVGCMAPGIRYHEKNAAFSPSLNMSRAKIQYKDHYVQVMMDAKNTGEWTQCYRSELSFADDWMEKAHIGITASTGSLADNHDVIALSVYDDVIDMGHAVVDEKVKNVTALDLDEKFLNGDNMSKLRLLKLRYERMIEDFEHQITALKESTENTIKKLREQEEEDTKAIAEIEVWANSKVSQKVLSTVDVIRNEMEQKLETTVKDTVKKTGGWKTPFFILLIVIASAIGMAYKKYQDLRKSHLL